MSNANQIIKDLIAEIEQQEARQAAAEAAEAAQTAAREAALQKRKDEFESYPIIQEVLDGLKEIGSMFPDTGISSLMYSDNQHGVYIASIETRIQQQDWGYSKPLKIIFTDYDILFGSDVGSDPARFRYKGKNTSSPKDVLRAIFKAGIDDKKIDLKRAISGDQPKPEPVIFEEYPLL